MKTKNLMDCVSNTSYYNKLRKKYLDQKGLISCDRCPYNRGENRNRTNNNWKEHRRNQYK